MAEIELTNRNFEQEVIKSDLPVLIDFWASWCGPCRMMAPVIAQIAEEYEGKVKVGKLNIDEQPSLAIEFGIESIPTFLVFRGGKVVRGTMGVQPKANIEELLK